MVQWYKIRFKSQLFANMLLLSIEVEFFNLLHCFKINMSSHCCFLYLTYPLKRISTYICKPKWGSDPNFGNCCSNTSPLLIQTLATAHTVCLRKTPLQIKLWLTKIFYSNILYKCKVCRVLVFLPMKMPLRLGEEAS